MRPDSSRQITLVLEDDSCGKLPVSIHIRCAIHCTMSVRTVRTKHTRNLTANSGGGDATVQIEEAADEQLSSHLLRAYDVVC